MEDKLYFSIDSEQQVQPKEMEIKPKTNHSLESLTEKEGCKDFKSGKSQIDIKNRRNKMEKNSKRKKSELEKLLSRSEKGSPECRRCRNHGQKIQWKAHKKVCPNRYPQEIYLKSMRLSNSDS